MPMPPIRFSICSELFSIVSGKDFYETVDAISDLGADMEIATFTEGRPITQIGDPTRTRRKQYLKDKCVRVSGLHWILAGGEDVFRDEWAIPGGPQLTQSSFTQRNKTADYAIEVFRYATDLRGEKAFLPDNPLVAVWGSPGQRNLSRDIEHADAERHAAEVFARILKNKDHCVTIALERLVRGDSNGDTNFCYTMEQVDRVVDLTREQLPTRKRVDMRSMLDVKAAVGMNDDPLDVLENKNLIHHVHVQDPHSLGPPGWNARGEFLGDGYYDMTRLLRRLAEIAGAGGYVCISMEPFKPFFDNNPAIMPYTAFKESLAYMKGVVTECTD